MIKNDEKKDLILEVLKKLIKNSLIVLFILSIASLIKNGEIQMPPLPDRYPSIAYLLYLIPLFGLAFLYPFTKYGAMIFLGFIIPKKYGGDISDTTLMFLAHTITIVIWIMVASGIISPEYSGPNSRAEHYLGL